MKPNIVTSGSKGGTARLGGIAGALLAICLAAQAQSIAVQNSSFETATLPIVEATGANCNLIAGSTIESTGGSLAGWTGSASVPGNAAAGAFAPTSGGSNWASTWWTETNMAYLQASAAGTVSLSQTLPTLLQSNTTYTLSALVGRRVYTPRFNYALQLWAGSTLLASGSNLALTRDTSGVDFADYSSGPNNPQAGQPLTIVLSSTGAAGTVTEAFFDNIALVASPSSGVQNPSFEAATLPIDAPDYGPFSQLIAGSTVPNYALRGTVQNWIASSTTKNAGVGAQAPILGGNDWTTKWWTGNTVGWAQTTAAGTASLSQTLQQTLENNTVYTLSAMVGRPIITTQNYEGRNLPIHFNYSIQLWAGSTLLKSASNLALTNGGSGTDSLTYSSGLNNPQAGQRLMIVLSSTGSDGAITSAAFDNIALTATTGSVAVNGVVSASAFGAFSAISPGSWIEIYGSNLAADTRSWNGSDFSGANAPTKLDGTFVTIGGELAFVDFISPVQVNALVPSNVGTGPQQLTVTTPGGVSIPFTVNVNSVEPGLLAPSSFDLGGTQYVVAQFIDGTYVLPTGAIAGVNSRPAKPGDTVVIYGVGFGPVVPNLPAGQLVGQSNTLGAGFQMSIGGQPAMAQYSGLAPNYTGLYQFNIVIPNAPVSGTIPLTFTLDGTPGTQTLSIAVQN